MNSLFTPSKYTFPELMIVLKRGVTRGDMRELAIEEFRAQRNGRGTNR